MDNVNKLSVLVRELRNRKGPGDAYLLPNQQILEAVKAKEKIEEEESEKLHTAAARAQGLDRLVLLDPITELYNYTTFIKELKAELTRAKRYHHQVSLLMLSIDNLDAITSQYGYLTKEAVLKVVANVLRTSLKDVDTAAKYSLERFVAVLPQSSSADAALASEKIRQRVGNQVICYNWQNFSITASIGVASYPQHAQIYDELIARALECMESATARGGDRVLSA